MYGKLTKNLFTKQTIKKDDPVRGKISANLIRAKRFGEQMTGATAKFGKKT